MQIPTRMGDERFLAEGSGRFAPEPMEKNVASWRLLSKVARCRLRAAKINAM